MKDTYGKLPKGITVRDIKARLSPRNIELIEQFMDYKRGAVSDKRLTMLHNSMVKFADLLELNFDAACKENITKAWNIIYSSPELSLKTKQDEYLNIRQAFKYWFGDDEEFPKVVRGMKRPTGRKRLKLPEDMPTEETIHKAIKLCRNSRDKFLVAYEGLDAGARPVELRKLTWKDLKQDQYGYFFNVWTAKNSGNYEDRPIRIIYSEPYFLEWMKNYPGTRQDDEYIFCKLDDPMKRVSASAITSLFKRLKKKLGLKKFHIYLLRHATLTRMGKNPNVPLSVLKKFAGHTQTSVITGEYQHYGADDVKEMQLNYAGQLAAKEDKSYELQKHPVKCPRCGLASSWDAEICTNCHFALSQHRNTQSNTSNERLDQLEENNRKTMEMVHELNRILLRLIPQNGLSMSNK